MLSPEKQLQQGLSELGLAVDSLQQEKLMQFLQLLRKWNAAFNLTAITEPNQMVVKHLLDSVAIAPHLTGSRLIDVGTGAGLPGIPLSIVEPQRTFFLLDSNQKKQVFVNQTIKTLALENAQGVHCNVQTYQATQKFSTILTRAFAPLEKMLACTSHLLAPDGRFLAMMGKICQQELAVPPGFVLQALIALKVPFEPGERHLAIITQA